jgi:predicted branched-subunit amino acid permease
VSLNRQRLRDGARAGIPFAFAAFLLAISFGVIARPVIGGGAAIAMSAIVFAGSSQFAAVAVLAGGGDATTAVLAGILLNFRYLPMGIALAPSLRGGPLARAAVGQTMIDASWAMANLGGGRYDASFMVGATAASYPCWLGGTVIGVVAGNAIGNPDRLGLDALFPAFFLALLYTGELRTGRRAWVVAGLGAAISLALVDFAPAGVPVIAASLAALIGLLGGNESDEQVMTEEPAP